MYHGGGNLVSSENLTVWKILGILGCSCIANYCQVSLCSHVCDVVDNFSDVHLLYRFNVLYKYLGINKMQLKYMHS